MKQIYLTFCLLFCFVVLCAQNEASTDSIPAGTESNTLFSNKDSTTHTAVEPKALTTTPIYQAEKINIRKFDRDKWKKIVGVTNYEEKPERSDEQKKQVAISPWVSEILRFVVYVLIIALVIFLIYYITKNISLDYKTKKNSQAIIDIAAPVENIDDLDTQGLLQRAISNGDFRLAVRLHYLDLLKQLNQGGMIVWKKNKTNRDYLDELFSHQDYFKKINTLTLIYEKVWYGDHTLTKESFRFVALGFESLHHHLNTPETP